MDTLHSRNDNEFGSVYSFDGLYQKLKDHQLEYPSLSPRTSIPSPFYPIPPQPTPNGPPLRSPAWGAPVRNSSEYCSDDGSNSNSSPASYGELSAVAAKIVPAVSASGFRRFSVFSQRQYGNSEAGLCGGVGDDGKLGDVCEVDARQFRHNGTAKGETAKLTQTSDYQRVR